MINFIAEILSQLALVFALHISNGSFEKPLPAAQEQRCFQLAGTGDRAAREKLIVHNLRLVAHISKKYYASRMEPDDLISIGTVGLIKAIDSFNPQKGARFATYAARCIENEILMTFRSMKKEHNTILLGDTLGTDAHGNSVTPMDLLYSDSEVFWNIESGQDAQRMRKSLHCLSPQELNVIELRYGLGGNAPLPQRETAILMGISRSYVSRIEKRALQKLRGQMSP